MTCAVRPLVPQAAHGRHPPPKQTSPQGFEVRGMNYEPWLNYVRARARSLAPCVKNMSTPSRPCTVGGRTRCACSASRWGAQAGSRRSGKRSRHRSGAPQAPAARAQAWVEQLRTNCDDCARARKVRTVGDSTNMQELDKISPRAGSRVWSDNIRDHSKQGREAQRIMHQRAQFPTHTAHSSNPLHRYHLT